MIKTISSLFLLFFASQIIAQDSHKHLRAGDKNYLSQDYAAAEESYRKSLQTDKTLKGKYNLGNTVYNQNRHEEAMQYYEEALSLAQTNEEKGNAYYNLGNAQFKNQKLKESIESYKQSLRINPEDTDARKNLFLAKMMQQQQQQQQQQQENNEDENNEENDQQQQDQQENNQQEQDEQSQEQPQEGQENPQENNPQEGEQTQQQELSKEDAERLLQIIENEEKKVQERLKKVSGKKPKSDKDW